MVIFFGRDPSFSAEELFAGVVEESRICGGGGGGFVDGWGGFLDCFGDGFRRWVFIWGLEETLRICVLRWMFSSIEYKLT